MSQKRARLRRRFTEAEISSDVIWAMEPRAYARLREATAGPVPEAAFQRRVPPADDVPMYEVQGGVAVIRFEGIVAKRLSFWSWLFGGSASTEQAQEALQTAVEDASVRSILLVIDSPGGGVAGVSELAAAVRAAKAIKPVNAFGSDMIASAAYWIGAQATGLYVNATTRVGSIGVYLAVDDVSRMLANDGVEVNLFASGPQKGAGSWGTELTDAQKLRIQAEVERMAALFVADVARGRGVSAARIQPYADGGCLIGDEAVRAGLADGVMTLQELLGRMSAEQPVVPEGVDISIDEPPEPENEEQDEISTTEAREAPETRAEVVARRPAPEEEQMSEHLTLDMSAVLTRLEAVESQNASLREAVAGASAGVTAISRDRAFGKLVADLRGENGGAVRLAAADSLTLDHLAVRFERDGEDKTRAWAEANLAVLGGAQGSVIRGTREGPGASTSTARHSADFVGGNPAAYEQSRMPIHEAVVNHMKANNMTQAGDYRQALAEVTRRRMVMREVAVA